MTLRMRQLNYQEIQKTILTTKYSCCIINYNTKKRRCNYGEEKTYYTKEF